MNQPTTQIHLIFSSAIALTRGLEALCPGSVHMGHGRLSLWVFGLAMVGSLLTAMAALGAAGSDGPPEGPECSEGVAKQLDAPLPAAHAVSHMY